MASAASRATAWVLAVVLSSAFGARAEDLPGDEEIYGFDDSPLAEPMEHPDWFKESFLDLGVDLKEAVAAGKRGLIVYFGQRRCAYCQKLLKVNFGLEDIAEYTRAHFDVVPIDVWGVAEVTDLQGRTRIERDYAAQLDTVFTPSLLFFDVQGELVLRLRGYYPPYQFRAALEYVADGHYQRESFRDYLARGDNRMVFDATDLNEEPFFAAAPYNLDRRVPSDRPLVVFFEQGDCHACDVLHGQALREREIYENFEDFDAVQLGMWSDTPVVTPGGERTTARDWSAQLGLFYAPSLLFFDERGKELLRVDSVVAFYRLRHVLTYIRTKAYLEESFPQWRERQFL
jgi:thioredoxin-related protein